MGLGDASARGAVADEGSDEEGEWNDPAVAETDERQRPRLCGWQLR
jgi:hypothetical protein